MYSFVDIIRRLAAGEVFGPLDFDAGAPIYMPVLLCTNIALRLNCTYRIEQPGDVALDINAGTAYCEL